MKERFMKRKRLWITLMVIVFVVAGLILWIRFNNIYYRVKPEVAMEQYLEDRYHEDFVLKSVWGEKSFKLYSKKTLYKATFTTDALKDNVAYVEVVVNKDRTAYKHFYDTYQMVKREEELGEMAEEYVSKYFQGDYYICPMLTGYYVQSQDKPVQTLSEYADCDEEMLSLDITLTKGCMEEDAAIVALMHVKKEFEKQHLKVALRLLMNEKEGKTAEESCFSLTQDGKRDRYQSWNFNRTVIRYDFLGNLVWE